MFKNLRINKVTLVDINSVKLCNYFQDIDDYSIDAFVVSDFQNSTSNLIPNITISSVINSTLRNQALTEQLIKGAVTVTIRDLYDNSDYILFKGQISSVTIYDNWIDIDCQGFANSLNQDLNLVYDKLCYHDLGDKLCGVNTATYEETGSVTEVVSRSEFKDSSRTEADNYFRYGILTFTSGNNNGITREVLQFDSADDQFTFFIPVPYDIQVSDTYTVYQGCDKSADTCKNTFSNYENFGGYAEYTPDQDDLVYDPDDDDEDDLDDESDEVDDAA